MQEDFADWMRPIDLGVGSTNLELRWAGLNKLVNVDGLEVANESSLIEFIFSANTECDLSWFQKYFKDEDANFSMDQSNNKKELITLASIALFLDIQLNVSIAGIVTATKILTAFCNTHRKLEVSVPLINYSQDIVAEASCSQRNRTKYAGNKALAWPQKALKESIDGIDIANGETVKSALFKIIETTSQHIKSCNTKIQTMEKSVRIKDEELDILWWLFNGYSELSNKKFSDIEKAVFPIVVGTEISDKINATTAPPALNAIFSKLGIGKQKISLDEMIEASANILDSLSLSLDNSPILYPVNYALACMQDAGAGSWSNKFERETGLKAGIKSSPEEWATQFIREYMLLKG